MWVSSNGKSSLRVTHDAVLRRNGDYIDIHFNDDGDDRFVAVLYKDWVAASVILKEHGDSIDTRIDFDTPATLASAFRDFIKKDAVRQYIDD